MQSTLVALLAIFAAGVCAAPLNPLFDRATCEIKTCVVALQPSFPTACDPAALQLGANTPLNTACLAAAAKGTTAFVVPRVCPLRRPFGVTDPGNKSQTATNGATGNAAPASGGKPVSLPRAVLPSVRAGSYAAGSRQLVQHGVPGRGRQGYRCLPHEITNADGASQPTACDGCAAQFGVTDPGASAQAAGMAIN
ncbi:hypothetical protein B0H13DRAFT_1877343 [Mycena leptocephala]|nr:hypothetical protein B0H13DRAFT_1877343 [Mycena leptocephala]